MAARFAKEVDPSIEIKPNQPYGEVGRLVFWVRCIVEGRGSRRAF